ncbi:hypothetical protein [Escherichia coli]|uniref:hypothetical protein n=1 Tax=Escherichia coli TaxID=562 RepID=UPI002FCCE3B3
MFINILFFIIRLCKLQKINANELAAERDAQKRLNTRKKFVITRFIQGLIQNNGLIQRQLLKAGKAISAALPDCDYTRSDIELRQIAPTHHTNLSYPGTNQRRCLDLSERYRHWLNTTNDRINSAPDANGMVPLASVGSQPVKVSSGGTSLPELNNLRASCPTANRIFTAWNILEIR